ncbi:MAG: RdgB/HAM1 family non-canonical purine NTP pyrophosphatase [Candidatus Omnitrophota bacterium]
MREIRTLFGHPRRWQLVFLDRYPDAPRLVETGKTFDDNAALKACAIARYTGKAAISDDSGIEIEALGGNPGVRSARFAGENATDEANNEKLLRLLRDLPLPKRKARYRCSLALALPGRKPRLFHGSLAGRIGFSYKGRFGFGYDPLFILPRFGKTVAQLPPAVKNKISHRARAFQRLKRYLTQHPL